MPYYDSALQVHWQTGQTFGGLSAHPQVVRVHAVERVDQQDRDNSATLCGLPTSGMDYQEAHTLNFWPPARFTDVACTACRSRVP